MVINYAPQVLAQSIASELTRIERIVQHSQTADIAF